MDITFSNFGKIKNAKIELNGLTVIAGKNDTGKSTIGKAMYSIVRSVADFPEKYKDIQNPIFVRYIIQSILPILREKGGDFSKIAPYLNLMSKEKISDEDIFTIINFLKKSEDFSSLKADFDQILSQMKAPITDDKKFQIIAADVFSKCFEGKINNSVDFESVAEIFYNITTDEVAHVAFCKNIITDVRINTVLKPFALTDAILIDTPLYLEKQHTSSLYYAKDLKDKIAIAIALLNKRNEDDDLLKKIQSLMGTASFAVDETTGELNYSVSQKSHSLNISNIASGTKSLGLLMILLKTGILNSNTMLILDEPEVYLHPEWQIRYAEFLTILASKNIPILLTSHSPTFIQALMQYARKNIAESKVNFYLASKIENENYSNFENVNNDIDQIFDNLISPTDELFEDLSL